MLSFDPNCDHGTREQELKAKLKDTIEESGLASTAVESAKTKIVASLGCEKRNLWKALLVHEVESP